MKTGQEDGSGRRVRQARISAVSCSIASGQDADEWTSMRLIASTTRVPLAAMLLLAPFPWQLSAAQETAPVVAQANVTDPNPATRPAAVPPSDAVKALYRERLGRSFAQRTRSMLQREYVFIGMLESGKTLLEVALAISPDDPNLWRLALDYAVTMEDGDDDAVALVTTALTRINQLEPDDEVMRLRRLLRKVEAKQTVQERIAAIEILLTPESIQKIGSGVAARLAFDCAVLLRQSGDPEGFERELLHALDLDPHFPEAAEVAAGYFRVRATSAVEEATALRAALLANPTRGAAAMDLADLCLSAGAYRAAGTILTVEAELLQTNFPDLGYDGILSELCIAFWGSEQPESALSVARRRQEALNRVFRETLDRQGSTLPLADRQKLVYPMSMALSSSFAALARSFYGDEAKSIVALAAQSAETTLRAMEEQKATSLEIAEVSLEAAFVQLWLDGDIEKAQAWIDSAALSEPLSDAARARFDGWLALRRKDAAKAKELFAPIAENDPAARLGLGLADEILGDKKAAARSYLAAAKAQPSTAMGLWSRDRLRGVLGSKVSVIAVAEDVEKAATLPDDFLEMMSSSSNLLLRVRPRKSEVTAYEPMIFDIDITNRGRWPIAITPEGPLADTATLTASVNVPGAKPTVPPFALVAINRRFAIAPGETLTVPMDLTLTDASVSLRDDPLSGAFVTVHPIVNWRTTDRGLEPGPLGVETESPLVHVRGDRITPEWVAQTLAQVRDTARTPDPEVIAALAAVIVRASNDPLLYDAATRALLADAPKLIADATRRLWPEARAWMIFAAPKGSLRELSVRATDVAVGGATTPKDGGTDAAAPPTMTEPSGVLENTSSVPELAEFDAVLAADETPIVRMAWIAVRCKRPEDPILDQTAALSDPVLSQFAKDSKSWMNDVRDERRRKLNLSK